MNNHLLFTCLYPPLIHWVLSTGSKTVLKEDNSILLLEFHREFYSDVIKKIKDALLDDFQDNSNTCSQQLIQFWSDLDDEKRAAYFDSFGKVGAGILTGNVRYLGYYDQCIDIGNTDYCRFPFDLTLTNTTISSNESVTVRVPFEFGMCFPSSCNAKDFYDLLFIGLDRAFYSKSFTGVNVMNYTMNVFNLMPSIEYTEPLCPWRDLEWTNSSIIMLTICVLLIVLVITGTITDISLWFINEILPKLYLPRIGPQKTTPYSTFCEVKHSINEDEPLINAKPKPKASQSSVADHEKRCIEFVKDLILSFSLYKTVPAIMTTHQPVTAITSINGMRVISMFWVILGHTYLWEIVYDVVANSKEAFETTPKRFFFQPVVNFTFSVDSFFVLSGLLLSYLSIREMEHNQGKLQFISFYVHRLSRLSPAHYFAVFMYFKVLPHVGSGPIWFFDVRHCEKYWWTNILYINNFYPVAYLEICDIVTWYLATLMQFFVISPIFLLLLYHCWKIGLVTIAGTMLASIAILGTLVGIKNFNANLMLQGVIGSSWNMIYGKPYCRINAYLIGIVLGFILYKKWRVRSNLWIRICFYSVMWTMAAACCSIVIFGQYKTWNGHPFNKAENVMYFMFSRTSFSIGIALMIYACHNGFGGVINEFLSWKFWVPLSRLTFMTYLFHPFVFILMYSTMRFRYIYTDWLLIIFFAAGVVLSYSLALIVAVTVEYPIANVKEAVYKFIGMKKRK